MAENKKKQEEYKCGTRKPPVFEGPDQAHCKDRRSESDEIPCTHVQPGASGPAVLESSNLRHVLSESETSSIITPGTKLTRKVIKGGKI